MFKSGNWLLSFWKLLKITGKFSENCKLIASFFIAEDTGYMPTLALSFSGEESDEQRE